MASGKRPTRKRGANAYDQALKLLGERWAAQLATFLYPGSRVEMALPGDLPIGERRADWLWRAHYRGETCVLHVEFQLRGKRDMARRMFVYASRIVERYALPPRGVLVYLVPTRPMVEPPFLMTHAGDDVMWYPFQVVKLWEVDPAPVLTEELAGLVPLVPLMRGAAVEQLPALAERVVSIPEVDALQRGDLLGVLATLGALRFPTADIWDLLRRDSMMSELIDELIEDSPFLRKIHDDAVQEGRQEGALEGARSIARGFVLARFPELSAEVAALDRVGTLARLQTLAEALAGAPDIEAARAALRGVEA